MESLSERSASAIINSPKYDNLTDRNILNLLSNVYGFDTIDKVEEYVRLIKEKNKWAKSHINDITQWKNKYKSYSSGINVLRAIKDINALFIILIAMELKDYEVVLFYLRKHPEDLDAVITNINIKGRSPISFIVSLHRDLEIPINIDTIDERNYFDVNNDDVNMLLKYVDFHTDNNETALDIIHSIDNARMNKEYIRKLISKLFDSNEGLKEYVQNKIRTNFNYLLYDTLSVLEELGLNVFPPAKGYHFAEDILGFYINAVDDKMIDMLMDHYGIKPTDDDVNTAYSVDDYDLTRKLLDMYLKEGGDIKNVVGTFVEFGNSGGLKWLVNEYGIDIKGTEHSFLYSVATSKEVMITLHELGVEITYDVIAEMFNGEDKNMKILRAMIDEGLISLDGVNDTLVDGLGEEITGSEDWKLLQMTKGEYEEYMEERIEKVRREFGRLGFEDNEDDENNSSREEER